MQRDITIDGFRIALWTSEHADPPITATNMTVACKRLRGYGLSDAEKTDVVELMAGYCRLVDEAGLVGYGDTEFEAIADLFGKATKV